ncbi:hypothetical protein SteCoe_26372 [Stentor coeruleus]|uniref:Uncharacterized protein n=1 Tax=Stentor coeruleus TaxID=5963 RepID=A0A1R2BD70_9CILI|nr:hypothetical protein SteCoe_26372 [Stentor coeruleus]
MKSYSPTSKPKQLYKEKSTQTEFSVINYEYQIHQKDKKIQQLQKALQKFISPTINPPISAEKSINISIESERISPYFYQQKILSSEDFESSLQAIKSLSAKMPLDTANIEEINKLASGNSNFVITPEQIYTNSKLMNKPQNKSPLRTFNDNKNSKSNLVKQSKKTLNTKPKMQKQSSIITELLYQDDQDKSTWNVVMNKFRDDPQLLSRVLHQSKNKETNKAKGSISVEPYIKNRIDSVYRNKKYTREQEFEIRPISAVINKPKKSYRSITAKVKDSDWSKSILDTYVAQRKTEFPSSDPSILTSQEVEGLLQSKVFDGLDFLYEKAVKTLEILKYEMMIPQSYMIIPPRSKECLEKILENCFQLFKARVMIIKVLQLIHMREECLLKLMAKEVNIEKEFSNLQRLGKKIIHIIMYLKCTKFPIGTFVYLGEDYAEKIQKDLESVVSVYPDLRYFDFDEGNSYANTNNKGFYKPKKM